MGWDVVAQDRSGEEIDNIQLSYRDLSLFQDAIIENHPHLVNHPNTSVRKGARLFNLHFGLPDKLSGKQGKRILAFLLQCASEIDHPVVKRKESYCNVWLKDIFDAEAYYMEDMLRLFRALATSRKNKLFLC